MRRSNPAPATAALVGLVLLLASSSSATAAAPTLLRSGDNAPDATAKAKATNAEGVFFSDSFDEHPVGTAPLAPWATTVSKGAC